MKSDFFRLECRIQRWNTTQPGVFLIDARHQTLPTAVFNKNTHESMDNIKGLRPRPLKTHAYNFNQIHDEQGNLIVENRAKDKTSAEVFVKKVLGAAKPIEYQAYKEELDCIIWPSQEDRAYSKRPRAYSDTDLPLETRGIDFIAARSNLQDAPLQSPFNYKSKSARKHLLRQITDLVSTMDEEDLEALLKLARTLAEED